MSPIASHRLVDCQSKWYRMGSCSFDSGEVRPNPTLGAEQVPLTIHRLQTNDPPLLCRKLWRCTGCWVRRGRSCGVAQDAGRGEAE
eukprot:1856178-Rhodomonas_salina.1